MPSKPNIGSDHIDGTPEQGQVHVVGSEPDPCAVMPMHRGQEAAHQPCRGQPNFIFFSFLTAYAQKNQTVMSCADLFISIHPLLTSILLNSTHRRVDRRVADARTALRAQSAGHHQTVQPGRQAKSKKSEGGSEFGVLPARSQGLEKSSRRWLSTLTLVSALFSPQSDKEKLHEHKIEETEQERPGSLGLGPAGRRRYSRRQRMPCCRSVMRRFNQIRAGGMRCSDP
jgi:hypothetical protein